MSESVITPHRTFWATRRPEGQPAWAQVQASQRWHNDEVEIFVDDHLWGHQVDQASIDELARQLTATSPADPFRGLLTTEKALFAKDPSQPVTVLVGEHEKSNGGYVSLADFLSPSEAEAMGAHSNQQPVLYLNAAQHEKSLAQVASHELQHLFAFGHDRKDQRWLYEFMAQAATVLTGHETANPNDYPMESQGRPGRPFVSADDQPVNYPGLTRFAQYTLSRFGPDFLARLNADPATGLESFDASIKAQDPSASFETVLRDYLVDFHRSKQNAPFHGNSPGDFSECARLAPNDLFRAGLTPSAAFFVELDHDQPTQLQVDGLEPGVFFELLTRQGSQVLVPENGRLQIPAGAGRTLLVGSSQATTSLELRCTSPDFDPDRLIAERLADGAPLDYPFGHMKLHVPVGPLPHLDPVALRQEYAELEQLIAKAEGRHIRQPLPPVPEAAAESLRILHRVLADEHDQQLYRTFLGESGDPRAALGLVELLRGQPPERAREVTETFLDVTRQSRQAGHHLNTVNYSQLDSDGRYFANLLLFHSLMQPGDNWQDYHSQVGAAWNAGFALGAGGGSLGARRGFRAVAGARDPGEPLSRAAERAEAFAERLKKLDVGSGPVLELLESLPRLRPGMPFAELTAQVGDLVEEFPDLPKPLLSALMEQAYQADDLAGVKTNLQRLAETYVGQSHPVTSYQLDRRLEAELKAGKWPANQADSLRGELQREVEIGRLLGVPEDELVERAFGQVRERLAGERVSPNIEIEEGGIWIGDGWVPVED